MPVNRDQALATVEAFDAPGDGAAARSRSLTSMLLRHTSTPFAPNHYWPGHITCTALVTHPADARILVIWHHRLERWLLPGGHVEEEDATLPAAAAREAYEETGIRLDATQAPVLIGIDVHGIPPKQKEPYHLHHDLIWCFRAADDSFMVTPEAPQVRWAPAGEYEMLNLTSAIRLAAERAARLSHR